MARATHAHLRCLVWSVFHHAFLAHGELRVSGLGVGRVATRRFFRREAFGVLDIPPFGPICASTLLFVDYIFDSVYPYMRTKRHRIDLTLSRSGTHDGR